MKELNVVNWNYSAFMLLKKERELASFLKMAHVIFCVFKAVRYEGMYLTHSTSKYKEQSNSVHLGRSGFMLRKGQWT